MDGPWKLSKFVYLRMMIDKNDKCRKEVENGVAQERNVGGAIIY